MAKQSKSQRIRTLLAQGKSVKEIVKTVKCHPGLVYQVKSYDKSKAVKAKVKKIREDVAVRKMKDYENAWNAATLSTNKVPLGLIPKMIENLLNIRHQNNICIDPYNDVFIICTKESLLEPVLKHYRFMLSR